MSHGVIDIEGFAKWYYRLIYRILGSKSARRKVIVAIVSYSLIAFMLVPFGFVKNEFFPKSDYQEFVVSLEMSPGTTAARTQAEAVYLLEKLRQTPQTDFIVAEVGSGGQTGFMGSSSGNNLASITVHLPEEKKRSKKSMDIAEDIRKQFESYQAGKISVVEASGGPPAGADVAIKLSGDDLGQLDQIADQFVNQLKQQGGVTNIDKSIKPATSALVFVPDMTRLAQNGIGLDNLGLWLRVYGSGFTLDSVNFDQNSTEKEDISFRFGSENPSVEQIGQLTVPTQTGAQIPLLALGKVISKANPTVITREDGKRTISVSAGVAAGNSVSDQNKKLQQFAASYNWPKGYDWKTGGVNEENQKSVNSILQAMIVAFILILVTMVVQFKSYRQAVLVLLVIPLAVSSVFYVFALTGTPLSFPALIGVLSLFGIVVTNSMFIVDKINMNIKQGMEFREAIADAGSSRMEPIILTKLCTVLGLLPITLSNPLWRGLGGAIISGLLIASSIMLLFIPAVYYNWFNPNPDKAAK
jgi:multidrug efflux pump subunit AcrB